MFTTFVLIGVAVAAGFYFKPEETKALLKNAVAWVIAAGTAVAAYFDFDLSKFF